MQRVYRLGPGVNPLHPGDILLFDPYPTYQLQEPRALASSPVLKELDIIPIFFNLRLAISLSLSSTTTAPTLNSRNTSNAPSLPFLEVVDGLPGLEWTSEALDALASPTDG